MSRRRRPSPTGRRPTVDRTGRKASRSRHPAVHESTTGAAYDIPGKRSLRLAELYSSFDADLMRRRCLFCTAHQGHLRSRATAGRMTSQAALASRAKASTGTKAVTKTTPSNRTATSRHTSHATDVACPSHVDARAASGIGSLCPAGGGVDAAATSPGVVGTPTMPGGHRGRWGGALDSWAPGIIVWPLAVGLAIVISLSGPIWTDGAVQSGISAPAAQDLQSPMSFQSSQS